MWIELYEKKIDHGPNYVLATPSFRNQQPKEIYLLGYGFHRKVFLDFFEINQM